MEVGEAGRRDDTENGDTGVRCFVLCLDHVTWTGIPGAVRERLAKSAVSSQLKRRQSSCQVQSRGSRDALI